MNWIADPEAWIALVTLTSLEIVLGIDNIIFISILAGRLPKAQQNRARVLGLAVAMLSRVLLLLSIRWVMRLTAPLITVGREISGRDMILVAGGLFLLGKATSEIHARLEGEEEHAKGGRAGVTFAGVIVQIMLLDIVFSLDSVITAVGMVDQISIMVIAVIVAVAFMMFFSGTVSDFVHRHPTVKMLALAFLLMIGVTLIAEGFGQHIPKGYIYFAMAFSVFVEMLNLRVRGSHPVDLKGPEQEIRRSRAS
jgi:predicted tellurium resistance membrane protein TerC